MTLSIERITVLRGMVERGTIRKGHIYEMLDALEHQIKDLPKIAAETSMDIDGVENNKTTFSFESPVSCEALVEKNSAARRRKEPSAFEGTVNWASRGRLSLDEGEAFAKGLTAVLSMARAEVEARNNPGAKESPHDVRQRR